MTDTIRPEDQVLVALEDGKTFLIRVRVGQKHSTHKGAMEHDDVIGRSWGDVLITNTGARVYLLRPRWIDRMMKVHRRTNIMYPKDAAFLIAALGLQAHGGEAAQAVAQGNGERQVHGQAQQYTEPADGEQGHGPAQNGTCQVLVDRGVAADHTLDHPLESARLGGRETSGGALKAGCALGAKAR